MAGFAGDVNIWQERHFDFTVTVAFAGFATTARDVERETTFSVAADFCFGEHCEQIADVSEDLGVCRDVASRRSAYGGLIDFDNFIDQVSSI